MTKDSLLEIHISDGTLVTPTESSPTASGEYARLQHVAAAVLRARPEAGCVIVAQTYATSALGLALVRACVF